MQSRGGALERDTSGPGLTPTPNNREGNKKIQEIKSSQGTSKPCLKISQENVISVKNASEREKNETHTSVTMCKLATQT